MGFFDFFFGPNVKKMEENFDVAGLRAILEAHEGNSSNRRRSAEALGRLSDDGIRALVRILGCRYVEQSVPEAMCVLRRIGKAAVPHLISALVECGEQYMSGEQEQYLVELLGEAGDPQAVEVLSNVLLTDSYGYDARHEAVTALAMIGNDEAIKALGEALARNDRSLRNDAGCALKKMGEPAQHVLVQQLRTGSVMAAKTSARFLKEMGWQPDRPADKAAYALAINDWETAKGMGGEAVGQVVRILKDPTDIGSDDWEKVHETQSRGMELLGEIGGKEAEDALLQFIKQMDENRAGLWCEAAEALAIANPAAAVEALAPATRDDQKTLLCHYAIDATAAGLLIEAVENARGDITLVAPALARLGTPEAVPAFRKLLSHENDTTRTAAMKALGEFKDVESAEAIESALKDESEWVAAAAVQALMSLGETRSAEPVVDVLLAAGVHLVQRLEDISPDRLFGDYAGLVLRVATAEVKQETTSHPGAKYSHGICTYDLSGQKDAVAELCEIQTPLSSNLLHKVAGRPSINVMVSWTTCSFPGGYEDLSFEDQKRMAKAELERRGNPPHDPSVYLDPASWKR